jgi:inhibitor of KinA
MNYPVLPYRIFPLGDSAITIDFGNRMDETINQEVIARFHQLQQQPIPGMLEAVPAYSSITIYYDVMVLKKKIPLHQTVYERMRQQLEERLQQPVQQNPIAQRVLNIPVCYDEEFAWDIRYLATTKNISMDEVIQIHTAKQYRVYMLGFLPGFAYMGEVDEKITMPRKPQPVNISAGSVGIAGKQTGIYPLASPGGWQIIGRTPLKLFKASPNFPEGEASGDSENLETLNNNPTLLRAGDTVKFYSVTKNEFYEIKNSPSHRNGEGEEGEI